MVEYMCILLIVIVYRILFGVLFEDVVIIELLLCVIYMVNCGDV